MLYIIGIGLSDEKDITVKGLETVKKCDLVFLENYTSKLQISVEKLEAFYNKKIILANRNLVENNSDQILQKDKNVAFLVIGDALSATTHFDLIQRAKEKGIPVKIIHNASVLTAVGATGLQLYKFGRTVSIPFHYENLTSVNDAIKKNQSIGLHTLILLDLDPENDTYLSIKEALAHLQLTTKCIAIARLGSDDQIIKYNTPEELRKIDFGEPPFCIIVPGDLHFVEKELINANII